MGRFLSMCLLLLALSNPLLGIEPEQSKVKSVKPFLNPSNTSSRTPSSEKNKMDNSSCGNTTEFSELEVLSSECRAVSRDSQRNGSGKIQKASQAVPIDSQRRSSQISKKNKKISPMGEKQLKKKKKKTRKD